MVEKTAPLGICDHCGDEMRGSWYTSKHKPRRYCSRSCRNTANSQVGAPVRSLKAKKRVVAGLWVNPLDLESPEARREHARTAGRKGRLAEVEAGRWRNPALSEAARAKLSRPRTIDDPVVHRAQEKLNAGGRMSDLTPQEADAFRVHRREVAARRWEKMTLEQRERRRAQWREYKRRKRNEHDGCEGRG